VLAPDPPARSRDDDHPAVADTHCYCPSVVARSCSRSWCL
jgi:hypothetical protein